MVENISAPGFLVYFARGIPDGEYLFDAIDGEAIIHLVWLGKVGSASMRFVWFGD